MNVLVLPKSVEKQNNVSTVMEVTVVYVAVDTKESLSDLPVKVG